MRIQSKEHNEMERKSSDNNRMTFGNMVVNIKYSNAGNRLYDSLLNYFKALKNIEK